MAGVSLNGVYNHFIQDYVSKDVTQADAHRKDELRDVYKSIAKINKQSPLYLLTDDDLTCNDAIEIKEKARLLQGNIFSLSNQEDKSSLNHTSAFTSDDEKVDASYIGKTPDDDVGSAGFDIEVSQLATGQTNTGKFIVKDSSSVLLPDNYAFDVRIDKQEYEFQFSVYQSDKNIDVLQKLEKLINRAGIGLEAEVVEGSDNRAALQIGGTHTGIRTGEISQFEVYESSGELATGSVAALGLDQISSPAANAHFTLNGEDRMAISNHFTVGGKFDIQIKDVTTSPISVGVKRDNEALVKHISSLVDNYNKFVLEASGKQDAKFKSDKLKSEAVSIARQYMSGIEDMGIKLEGEGTISIDDEMLHQAVAGLQNDEMLKPIRNFTDALINKAKDIAVDPMKYVDRPVVNYKNPDSRDNTASPYITSEYSGMMFNNYC